MGVDGGSLRWVVEVDGAGPPIAVRVSGDLLVQDDVRNLDVPQFFDAVGETAKQRGNAVLTRAGRVGLREVPDRGEPRYVRHGRSLSCRVSPARCLHSALTRAVRIRKGDLAYRVNPMVAARRDTSAAPGPARNTAVSVSVSG